MVLEYSSPEELRALIEVQRDRRLESFKGITEAQLALESDTLFSSLEPQASETLRQVWQSVCALDYAHPGLTRETYLTHPLRVAELYANWVSRSDVPGLTLALCHNILEVGGEGAHSLLDRLSVSEAGLAGWVDTLTINRGRQCSEDYLESYYAGIAVSGPPADRVKVLDKMDNLHVICTNPDYAVRVSYLAEIETRLLPLARACLPCCEDYLTALVVLAREAGYVPLRQGKTQNSG